MRKLGPKAIVWSAGVALAAFFVGAAGCSNDKPTELVPGALSQVQVPRDLDGIELEVKADGVVKFCASASVYDGQVELPRTLGVVSGESVQTIVTVTIRGFSQSMNNPNFGGCFDGVAVGAPDGPQVLRRSIQTFVGQHTLFLPMPLSYSCFNTDCTSAASSTASASADTTTCAASRCVDLSGQDPKAAAAKLVDYTPSLVDGTDVCFSPALCFADEQPAVLANDADASSALAGGASDCTYEFETPPPGSGLNVKVFYQDFAWQMDSVTHAYETVSNNAGEVEILNEDPVEGFTVSPDNPQHFTLAPGLCDLVKAATTPPPQPASGTLVYHTISGVHAASACAPKASLLPICAGQRNPPVTLADGGVTPNLPDGGTTTDGTCNVALPLVPAPSALYMVMDDSVVMHAAFGMAGYATAINLSLTDPIFKRTYAGFKFLPHLDSDCTGLTTSFATPDVGFQLAAQAQPAIAPKLEDWVAPLGDTVASPRHLDLLAAMRLPGAYDEVLNFLQQLGQAPDVAGVMFFVNRIPDPTPLTGNDCPIANFTPLTPTEAARQALETEAQAAFAGASTLRTFFVVLDDDAKDGPTVAVPFYQQLQTDLPQAVTTIDATSSMPDQVLANFTTVVTQLGTCLYELPAGLTSPAQAQVTYSIPGAPATVVAVDPTCNAGSQNTANGWNVDENERLRICGTACTDLRNAILLAGATALSNNVAVPDVPVNAALLCGVGADAGAPSPAATDGGSTSPPDAAGTDASSVDATMTPSGDASISEDAAEAGPED